MVNVPSKNTLLFLQPLPPASPMLLSGAATSPIQSTTSSAGNPVDIRAAPVDHRQRERPRQLEQPRYPRTHNPPFERSRGKRSLRPLKPPFRQVPKPYKSVTTSVSVKRPARPRKHRTWPHVPFLTMICSCGRYGRWGRRHLEKTRTMVGRTCALLSTDKRQDGHVDGQRRTQKGPPGTVLDKYSRNVHWKRQSILQRAVVYSTLY